jgi:hypothetical protein
MKDEKKEKKTLLVTNNPLLLPCAAPLEEDGTKIPTM